MSRPLLVHFAGVEEGAWRVTRLQAVKGDGLPDAPFLSMHTSPQPRHRWQLRGVVSHTRYATADEVRTLAGVQEGLGRAGSTCAALIPIRKSAAWWSLAQDERREIFEEQSRHTQRSLKYLPAVARRLHHARDLGEEFDFVTWFEFAPEHLSAFEALVEDLRTTPEWRYVEREVDIRLARAD